MRRRISRGFVVSEYMTKVDSTPSWKDIELLLDELLDMSEENRTVRLAQLAVEAPGYAKAARLALAGASSDSVLDRGLEAVAGQMVEDMLNSEASDSIGSLVSNYRLDRIIGRGGMGVVYEASRVGGEFDQKVAIKKLSFGLSGERGVVRFEEERTILARVRHPFIAGFLDGGVDAEGLPYLVMELVDGGVRIDHYFAAQNATEVERLRLFKHVCNAVSFLHQNLITHGDLKPGNILVRPDGHPKLIDFGISRLSSSKTDILPVRLSAATPGYAAPEQALGEPITTRSDVFALGSTLQNILDAPRSDLCAIISKCVAPDPAERYGSVESLVHDIEAFEQHRTVRARPSTLGYRFSKYLRRQWLPVLSVLLVATTLAGGLISSQHQARIAEQEALRATVVSDFLIGMFEDSAETLSSDSDPTLRDLVEAGDRRLAAELASTPEVKADLQEILGKAYAGIVFDFPKARGHFEDVLAYDQVNNPGNTKRIISMMNWIADMYREEGNYQAAESIIDDALELDLRDGKPDSIAWMTKAYIANRIGTTEEMRAALERAEEFYVREYGASSNETAVVIAARANLALRAGDSDAAIAALQDAVSMREDNGGGGWISTERMRGNLALEYHRAGRLEDAAKRYEANVTKIEKRLGPDHGELVSVLNNLGALYTEAGNLENATSRLERALELASKDLEPTSFIRMAVEINLARAKLLGGEPEDAVDMLKDLLPRVTQAVGPEHAMTGVVQRDLAWAMLDFGDRETARKLIDLATPKLSLPAHIALAAQIDAELSLQEQDVQRAEMTARLALDRFNEAGNTTPWMFAHVRLILNETLLQQGLSVDVDQQDRDIALLREVLTAQHRSYPD